MLSYKLAKQLKEAGFPFRNTYAADLDMWSDDLSMEIDGTTYFIPTLEELIEWCREKCFGGMIHLNVMSDGIWGAIGELPHDGILTEMGKTPSKSMALLGLKLHEL